MRDFRWLEDVRELNVDGILESFVEDVDVFAAAA